MDPPDHSRSNPDPHTRVGKTPNHNDKSDSSSYGSESRRNSIEELLKNEQEVLRVCDLNEENLNNLKRIRKCPSFVNP